MDVEGEIRTFNDSFLISFEPLLDKYARLLERGNVRFNHKFPGRATPLGHHHRRGIVLPLAVSAHGEPTMATFNVSRIAGCSSLMRFNENTAWGAQCFKGTKDDINAARSAGAPINGAGVLEARMVPTISMDAAIALAPAGLPIEKLKLDAQGMDLLLLRSASHAALARVRSLELEVVKAGCTTLYLGQETHLEVYAFLRQQGFALQSWRWHGHIKCEGTGFFARALAQSA